MRNDNPSDSPLTPAADGDFGGGVPAYYQPAASGVAQYDFEDEAGPRRPGQRNPVEKYVGAVWRRKWLLAVAVVVGSVGAVVAYTQSEVQYTAQGNLWIQVEGRGAGSGDVGPISQGELLESTAWVELLRSFAVLDPVVVSERLYLDHPLQFEAAFKGFDLAERFLPGDFQLTIAPDGRTFAFATAAGAEIQGGTLGDSIGTELGFLWRPEPGSLPPEAEVKFSVTTPRDAARQLSDDLQANMDKLGNFISLSLSGPNPEKIASILNRVMDRHVELAAELKRRKLDEQLAILEDQLTSSAIALEVAERELEDFRVRTITLPSDASTPIIPGLEETRDPVFDRYFGMKVRLEEVQRSRRRLEEVAASIESGSVQVSSLEGIPSVGTSAELGRLLDELVQLRSQLRELRNNYTDDYPPIQDTLRRIRALETEAIPRVVNGLLAELTITEDQLEGLVASASAELESIPSRSIEESRRRRQVDIQENLYNELRGRVETARLAAASSIADIQILDRASVPQNPTSDSRIPYAFMAFFGAIGAAVGIAILLDRADRRIRHADEVDEQIGLTILGAIPRVAAPGSRGAQENASQVVEAFRELRMTVSFAHGAARPLLLTISSPAQSEGKTLITTNLAVAFAEMGRRTLLIDGDTRRGDAHRLLGVERSPGLSDYLRERTSGDIIRKTDYPNLDFIPCGTRGPTTPELLASHRMADFLATLKRAYDVILMDSPPLAAGADLLVLAGLTGQLAIVLRTGSTDKRLAVAKMETLSRLPIRVLGAILNDVEPKGEYYKYYASYLTDYQTTEDEHADGDGAGSRLLSRSGAAAEDERD